MNERFAVPGVDAHTTLGEAAPALALAKAEPLFALETAARGGADMEAVHRMRVASRRLREAMRLLKPLYPRKAYRTWYKRVRRITRALGPVRDSDVFIDAFSRLGRDAQLGGGGRRAVAFAVGHRAGQRIHELEVLNRELAGLDLEGERASFARFAGKLDSAAKTDVPLADFAHAAVEERAQIIFQAQPIALDEANVPEQHALRIDYKRLRYAVEALAPCYGDEFDDLHMTLTAFQDALGELHDVHVFLDTLTDPEHAKAAASAGVKDGDIAQVIVLLEQRAHAEFELFTGLAEEHPPQQLMDALLAPLSPNADSFEARPPVEAHVIDAPTQGLIADPEFLLYDEAPVVAPVVVGDTPWEDGWSDTPPELQWDALDGEWALRA